MSARLVARYFGDGWWPRLAGVLAHTADVHCPGWTLDIARITPAALSSPLGSRVAVANRFKLDAWADAVEAANDGEQLLLIDADTAIVRPLEDVWALPFDLAYTVKPLPPASRFPLNAGVVFVRVSEATKDAIRLWQTTNAAMFADPRLHAVWAPYYGGFNQAALGSLIRTRALEGLTVRRLPCVEWNCEDEHWHQFDPAVTRILHYKGALHRALTGTGGRTITLQDGSHFDLRWLVSGWLNLEEQAKAALEARRGALEAAIDPEAPAAPESVPQVPLKPDVAQAPALEDAMVRPEDLTSPEGSAAPSSRSARRRSRNRKEAVNVRV